MKYLRKFEKFMENAEPAVKPARPTTKPGTKPQRRQRPSPIRRDRPAPGTEPAPKAELPKASAKEVTDKFIKLAQEEGMDLKKYFKD